MTSAAMQIRPIRTEQDYDDALAKVALLMGATPGSPQGDELEVLATILDAYEARRASRWMLPIPPPIESRSEIAPAL